MSMQHPLVSVIIPVFNRAALIEETLQAIADQSYTNWECILVDDHSTDTTVDVVNKFIAKDQRFHLYSRPDDRRKGACSCRNYGFEKAKGVFVNWFDSDDIMHQDFLSLKVEAISKSNDIDGVVSKTAFFKDNIDNVYDQEKRTVLTSNLLEDFISVTISWYLPDVLWRKSFVEGKPLFDEALLMGQDRNFHIKMLSHMPKLTLVDAYLTYYRKHPDSISATYFSKKYADKTISHLKATAELVDYLEEKKLLNDAIKTSLYEAGIKYLPYTYDKKENKELISYLKNIFVFNLKTIKNQLKFYIAMLVFKLTGKGYAILKF